VGFCLGAHRQLCRFVLRSASATTGLFREPTEASPMRTLIAIAVLAGALVASAPDADAGRRAWRGPPPPYYYYRYNHYRPHAYRPYPYRRGSVCQEDARHFDPNGTFRGFPCWARRAFGQGRR
jgi:hypothetical protein